MLERRPRRLPSCGGDHRLVESNVRLGAGARGAPGYEASERVTDAPTIGSYLEAVFCFADACVRSVCVLTYPPFDARVGALRTFVDVNTGRRTIGDRCAAVAYAARALEVLAWASHVNARWRAAASRSFISADGVGGPRGASK